jgi:hypothetical protein
VPLLSPTDERVSKRQRKGPCGRIPLGRIACQRSEYYSLDRRNDARDQNRGRSERIVQDMRGKVIGRCAIERQPPGQKLVEHRPKRIDIGSLVDCSATQLLWSHILRRPHGFPVLSERDIWSRGVAELASDAKVGELWMPVRIQEHVPRLDISMNDSAAMGRIQAVGYLHHQPGRLGWGKLALASPEVA